METYSAYRGPRGGLPEPKNFQFSCFVAEKSEM